MNECSCLCTAEKRTSVQSVSVGNITTVLARFRIQSICWISKVPVLYCLTVPNQCQDTFHVIRTEWAALPVPAGPFQQQPGRPATHHLPEVQQPAEVIPSEQLPVPSIR